MNNFQLLKIGTDAEVFLRSVVTQEPVPAVGLIGGTKVAPIPIEELGKGFALQEDNVTAEFNIPPASSAKEFSESIERMLSFLKNKMMAQGFKLAIEGSMHFSFPDLQTDGAQAFGCEPDFCAWTSRKNSVNLDHAILKTMRTAAAHIHTSYTVNGKHKISNKHRLLAVRAQDLFIGVPSILMDSDKERRILYGRAGAFRPKDYGHEYRVPGNFWIASEKSRDWVFSQTEEALHFASTENGEKILMSDKYIAKTINQAINEHDENLAFWLCNEFKVKVPNDLIAI